MFRASLREASSVGEARSAVECVASVLCSASDFGVAVRGTGGDESNRNDEVFGRERTLSSMVFGGIGLGNTYRGYERRGGTLLAHDCDLQ